MTLLGTFSMFQTIAIAIAGYCIGVGFYRLTLHPLAKYPGPLLAKISGWPDAISAFQGRRHIDHHRLHCKYGDVVRYAPNCLSFNSVKALNDIYADRNANLVKTGWTEASEYINQPANLHTYSDKRQHAQRKRLLAHAFSENALRTAEEFMLEKIRVWCDYLGQESKPDADRTGWSQAKDMGHWSNLLTLDILGELCFGTSFGGMETGNHAILDMVIFSARLVQMIAYLPIKMFVWPIFRSQKLLAALSAETSRRRWALRLKMRELVEKRHQMELQNEKEGTPVRKDFFHYLLRAHDPETDTRIQPSELVGEAVLLVGAGSDTSSTAIASCLFYLLRNPETLEKLNQEVRGAFCDIEDIRNGATLSSLRYLRSCVDEAMRMTPPVPGVLSRKILPGGATVDGHQLDAGTVVGVPIYAIHHNEQYFPDSFSFIPERWIEGSKTPLFSVTEEALALGRTAFCPFSLGSRQCLGKKMAYMELLTCIARIIWLFDLQFSKTVLSGEWNPKRVEVGRDRTNEYQLHDWLVSAKKGPLVEFKRRTLVLP